MALTNNYQDELTFYNRTLNSTHSSTRWSANTFSLFRKSRSSWVLPIKSLAWGETLLVACHLEFTTPENKCIQIALINQSWPTINVFLLPFLSHRFSMIIVNIRSNRNYLSITARLFSVLEWNDIHNIDLKLCSVTLSHISWACLSIQGINVLPASAKK